MGRIFTALADRERRKELGDDPELLAKATPDYPIGCKRVLITSDWYPTLPPRRRRAGRPAARAGHADGVVGADGVERPADVIIYGTGFASHDFVAPMEVRGSTAAS